MENVLIEGSDLNLKQWLYEFAHSTKSSVNNTQPPSSAIFAFTIWAIWHSRNALIHGKKSSQMTLAQYTRMVAPEFWTYNRNKNHSLKQMKSIYLKWHPPQLNYVKLNIDASCNLATGLSTMGCILRDEARHWIVGHGQKLGSISILGAKIWAIYFGLCLALRMGIFNIEIQTDS